MKKVGIIARQQQAGIQESLLQVTRFLQAQQIEVLLESSAKNIDTLVKQADLIVVIGGDGSLLHAAHDVVASGTPMVGINRGRLGFLADISPDDIEKDLKAILQGHFRLEKRFLLESSVDGEIHRALNEIALSSDINNSMIEFDVFIDDQFLLHDKSDGLIIATPTGSTAYALSGGGPILHPELNSVALVPMFSHTLSSRPIVINANHDIHIELCDGTAGLSHDGKCHHHLQQDEKVTIKKHQQLLNLVHPQNYDYFDTLRTKLHWSKPNSNR